MDEIFSDSASDSKHIEELAPRTARNAPLEIESYSKSLELLEKAELLLNQKDSVKAKELIAELSNIAETDPTKILEQAMILSRVGAKFNNKHFLSSSNKKLRLLLKDNPNDFSALKLFGKNLMHLYALTNQLHYLWDAQKALELASKNLRVNEVDVSSSFFWDIASCYMMLAPVTKEPLELCKAMQFFHKAAASPPSSSSVFYTEWARCCLALCDATADVKYSVKALQILKIAVKKAKTKEESPWQDMANALNRLYKGTVESLYFSQAKECYELSVQRHPTNISYLLEYAQFALDAAQQMKDTAAARIALDKSKALLTIHPHMLRASCIAAAALSIIGEQSGRLDLLTEAHDILIETEELFPQEPLVQSCMGQCFSSFAQYYQDIEYSYLAIEKFQAALSTDRSRHSDWDNMGQSFFAIAEQLQDISCYDKALDFFQKARSYSPHNTQYLYHQALTTARLGEVLQSPEHLESAIDCFEYVHLHQKNTLYVRPKSFFEYARALDLFADFHEEEKYYTKAIDILLQLSLVHPHFPKLYHQLGISFSHLADLTGNIDSFYKALHYLKIASKTSEENATTLLDMGITLINIATLARDHQQESLAFIDAYETLKQAALLGEGLAFYQLACLYSLQKEHERAFMMLQKARQYQSLPSLEELNADEWLDSLRETPEWDLFTSKLE